VQQLLLLLVVVAALPAACLLPGADCSCLFCYQCQGLLLSQCLAAAAASCRPQTCSTL
jgi:hypothetical protein